MHGIPRSQHFLRNVSPIQVDSFVHAPRSPGRLDYMLHPSSVPALRLSEHPTKIGNYFLVPIETMTSQTKTNE